ncbi:hypothetical protein [Solidesulfovibrio sp.]
MPTTVVARVFFLAACCLLLALPAAAQDDYRSVLGNEAGVFPGAEFKRVIRFPKVTAVLFETGASPAEISAYYTKDMAARGWKVEVNDVTDGAAFLLVTKSGRQAIVEAQRGLPGRTGFSVSL